MHLEAQRSSCDISVQRQFTYLSIKVTNGKAVEDQWMHLKAILLKATEEICGISKYGKWHKQTWWQENSVIGAVNEKSHTCEEGGTHLRISFWHLLIHFKKNKKSKF